MRTGVLIGRQASVSIVELFMRSRAVDLKSLEFLSWLLFACILAITCNQAFHPSKPRDFVYFYSAGRILNDYPPEQFYDYNLQKKVYQEVLPMKSGVYGPFAYPPFVALLFRPFANLSYWNA